MSSIVQGSVNSILVTLQALEIYLIVLSSLSLCGYKIAHSLAILMMRLICHTLQIRLMSDGVGLLRFRRYHCTMLGWMIILLLLLIHLLILIIRINNLLLHLLGLLLLLLCLLLTPRRITRWLRVLLSWSWLLKGRCELVWPVRLSLCGPCLWLRCRLLRITLVQKVHACSCKRSAWITASS